MNGSDDDFSKARRWFARHGFHSLHRTPDALPSTFAHAFIDQLDGGLNDSFPNGLWGGTHAATRV